MKERLDNMLVMRNNNNNAISNNSNANVNANKYVPYLQEMNRANNKYVPYLQEMNRANSNKILNPSQPLINIAPISTTSTPQQQQFPYPTPFQWT